MKRITLFTIVFLAVSMIVLAQDKLQSGSSYLQINSTGDVYLNNPIRKSEGRALCPIDGNILYVNYGDDFSGGTRIGNQAHFKDYGLVLGHRVSPSLDGEADRLQIIPFRHIGTSNSVAVWRFSVRDISHDAFLDLHYGDIKNLFTIHYKGNIGLGIANPQAKLDVAGTIRAQEIKIEATGWADFVFKKEYELPTLSEVENHIKEYKHLPDIPSESEVLRDGVSVGEMQAKLLQKIEELTLYIIEQDKRIKILEEEKQNNKLN